MTVVGSNPPFVHFSRNPPGPNTSCIEGFADSVAFPFAVPSGVLWAAVGSSSIGTYSRWAAFATRLTFVPVVSSAELDVRFARFPPSPSLSWGSESLVTITYPFAALRRQGTLRRRDDLTCL